MNFTDFVTSLAGPISRVRNNDSGGMLETDISTLACRVALATLVEPGDGVMGALIASLGAVSVVETLTDAHLSSERAAKALVERLTDADKSSGAGLPMGFNLTSNHLAAGVRRWLPRISLKRTIEIVEQAGRVGATLLVPGDTHWPSGFEDLGVHAPLLLWVRGLVEAVSGSYSAIALVGARAATEYGVHVATEAAAGLSGRGLTVTSGGAYGIDGAAHWGALRAEGTTVAYLAGGVDRVYPAGHERLFAQIERVGAIAAELPCGEAPTRWRFLQRNRLIAAATAATVVIEAGRRSGSINTANHAAALGRPLGAVPGAVTSPSSAGCHELMRTKDAICVTDAQQMAELVGEHNLASQDNESIAVRQLAAEEKYAGYRLEPDDLRVLDALSVRLGRTLEEVVVRSGVEPEHALSVLGRLQALGRTARGIDGWHAVKN